jgi:uncharacterized protein YecE (DUF72 family)
LGTQGFAFDDWVGPFYPPGTPKRAYLEVYATHFPTVEIDSTFYGPPRLNTVKGWAARTPPGFRFTAKFPRLITHDKKLDRARGDAEQFVTTMQALGEKLAVLILQFAYDFTPDRLSRLEAFLAGLPAGPRYAVEVRNRQWLTDGFRDLLAEHRVALVLQDLHYMPRLDWVSADFTVIRWLGRRADVERFDRVQIDRRARLEEWAGRVRDFLHRGLEVYGYFNNHFAGHSPASARQFAGMMGIHPWEAAGGEAPPRQLGMGQLGGLEGPE